MPFKTTMCAAVPNILTGYFVTIPTAAVKIQAGTSGAIMRVTRSRMLYLAHAETAGEARTAFMI
jgi:hypothetical protein